MLLVAVEDETGVADLVIWPGLFGARRHVVPPSRRPGVDGRVQREGEAVHVVRKLHRVSGWSRNTGRATWARPVPRSATAPCPTSRRRHSEPIRGASALPAASWRLP